MTSSVEFAGGIPLSASHELEAAYDVCEAITREHSKSFFFASALLPRAKRRAVRALYAFCRYSDDIVDVPRDEPERELDRWTRAERYATPTAGDPVLRAWSDTRDRYALPREVIDDLLAGVRMDLTVTRYESFAELERYCYRVASTVGLLSMHIIGYREGAEGYAIRLGIALQLTNILRDVGEDARHGRIYLPLDELASFGIAPEEILAGCLDERYEALMRFQIDRARRLYTEARPGIGMLDRDGRLAIAVAAEVYRGILGRIEANRYDNHRVRAYVPTWRKLTMLPGIWWSNR